MPSSLFFENLYRKLRLEYPKEIFGEESLHGSMQLIQK